MDLPKVDSSLIGAAGEHLVLSRLLSRGFLAAQAPRGVRKVDILVNFLDRGEPFLVQVKATGQGSAGWTMAAKHEGVDDKDLFYCFVDFGKPNPSVHVVPADVVARVVSTGHAHWLATPGRQGQVHVDTPMRKLGPRMVTEPEGWMDKYLENWDQLTR